ESGRLLDRDVAWLRPAQNLVDDVGDAPELARKGWSIGHQTAPFNVLPNAGHRRQSPAGGQDVDAMPIGVHERVRTKVKCIRALPERLERRCDVLCSPDFGCSDLKAELAGSCLGLAHVQYRGGIANISHDCLTAEIGYGLPQGIKFLSHSIPYLGWQTRGRAPRAGPARH